MARLTTREILVFVIIAILLAPLIFWGVLFLLGLLFDEPDPQAPGGAASENLVALRAAKISAVDPPSTWRPGERNT